MFELTITARRYNFVSVTRRSIRAPVQVPALAGPENSHGARRVWRGFWHPGTSFVESRCGRDTMLNGAINLSPVTNLAASTGEVSRYNLSRSQKFITVQDLNSRKWCVSGCFNRLQIVSEARFAKTVTSLLNIPSVLCLVLF